MKAANETKRISINLHHQPFLPQLSIIKEVPFDF